MELNGGQPGKHRIFTTWQACIDPSVFVCSCTEHRPQSRAMENMDQPDIKYICSLMEKNYDAVGFLPKPRLEQYAKCGQVIMAEENAEPCGYLVFGSGWPVLHVYQTCVQYDARRWQHGMALVRRLIAHADRGGFEAITLRCADDLDANQFWKAAGFRWMAKTAGGKKRGRFLNVWRMDMPTPLQMVMDFPRA